MDFIIYAAPFQLAFAMLMNHKPFTDFLKGDTKPPLTTDFMSVEWQGYFFENINWMLPAIFVSVILFMIVPILGLFSVACPFFAAFLFFDISSAVATYKKDDLMVDICEGLRIMVLGLINMVYVFNLWV